MRQQAVQAKDLVFTAVGRNARHDMVERGAQPPDVSATVHLFATGLFRGHVLDLALDPSRASLSGDAPLGLGNTKVDDLRYAAGSDQDVVRAYIAMYDPERRAVGSAMLVRGVQPGARVTHHP